MRHCLSKIEIDLAEMIVLNRNDTIKRKISMAQHLLKQKLSGVNSICVQRGKGEY